VAQRPLSCEQYLVPSESYARGVLGVFIL